MHKAEPRAKSFKVWFDSPVFLAMKFMAADERPKYYSTLGSAFYKAVEYARGEDVNIEDQAELLMFSIFKQSIDEEGAKE